VRDEHGKPYRFSNNGLPIPSNILPDPPVQFEFESHETFAFALKTWRKRVRDIVKSIHEFELSHEAQNEALYESAKLSVGDARMLQESNMQYRFLLTGKIIPANRFPPRPTQYYEDEDGDTFSLIYDVWIKRCKLIVETIHERERQLAKRTKAHDKFLLEEREKKST